MADLTPLKIEVAILEFVKVHPNTLSYLEMIWNLKMFFYDLFCDIFMSLMAKEILSLRSIPDICYCWTSSCFDLVHLGSLMLTLTYCSCIALYM